MVTINQPQNAYVEESLCRVFAIIFGSQFAIRLVARGPNDNHICYEILHEDDGNWFLSEASTSSYWLPDLINVCKQTEEWMKANAVPDIQNNVQFGYKMP